MHLLWYFRARAIRWCHLIFSPGDPCCHGNQFWDKNWLGSVKNNCALFLPTPLFPGLGLISPNLISPNPNPNPNHNPDCRVCNEMRLGEMRRHHFRVRVIWWCHLNFSPADPCCHGNEFWDKIDYSLTPMKNNCACLHLPSYTQLIGYIAWQWDRYLVPQNVFLVWNSGRCIFYRFSKTTHYDY